MQILIGFWKHTMASSNHQLGIASLQQDENDVSCLDIFKPLIVENDLIRGKDVLIGPINFNSEGPFEYHVKSSSNSYINMPTKRLHGCFQVVKVDADGKETNAVDADDYSLINLYSNSLFKQVKKKSCTILYNNFVLIFNVTNK